MTTPQTGVTLEEVLRRENLFRALARVQRNKGAPGVDGVTVEDLPDLLRAHWPRIKEELLSGRYRPAPVRRVEIPKPGGGVRELGIPTTLDRLIQQAIQQALTPVFDPGFSDASFGFRPRRSAQQAVRRAQEHVRGGRRWVVDMDLEKFFDRVNHDKLMSLVARRVQDKPLLRLIRRYLEAGMMAGGVVSPRRKGTPQGGPLSPLLSNVLLDELDKELERRGHRFVRYADDCNVYVRSRRSGERVLASLTCFLARTLRLRVNEGKSAVDRPWRRKFLGYSFTVHRKARLRLAPEAVKRARGNLRAILRRGRGRNILRVIQEVNRYVRGWVDHFREAEVKRVFEELDQWLRTHLRKVLWRQWKRPKTRAKKLRSLGIPERFASRSAYSGYGPWRMARSADVKQALPNKRFREWGLLSHLERHREMQRLA